jgi:hypothetical protein
MSSTYLIIFGILQDFTPKMLENRILGTLDVNIFPGVHAPGPPIDGLKPSAFASPPPKKNEGLATQLTMWEIR